MTGSDDKQKELDQELKAVFDSIDRASSVIDSFIHSEKFWHEEQDLENSESEDIRFELDRKHDEEKRRIQKRWKRY